MFPAFEFGVPFRLGGARGEEFRPFFPIAVGEALPDLVFGVGAGVVGEGGAIGGRDGFEGGFVGVVAHVGGAGFEVIHPHPEAGPCVGGAAEAFFCEVVARAADGEPADGEGDEAEEVVARGPAAFGGGVVVASADGSEPAP